MGKRSFESESDAEEAAEQKAEPVKVQSSSSGKTKKPLPPGYVCKACGMVDDHAIYNCSKAIKKDKKDKKDVKEDAPVETSEQKEEAKVIAKQEFKAKVVAAAVDAEDTKPSQPLTVFISGLPFKIKRTTLIDVFQKKGFAESLQGKDVKLVMFEDKPEKCRGLAYVTFKTEDDYKQALKLSGIDMEGRTLQIVPCAPHKSETPQGNKPFVKGSFSKSKLPEGVQKIPRCYRCGMLHDASQCSNKRICYKCKSTEHLSSACPFKKPKTTA